MKEKQEQDGLIVPRDREFEILCGRFGETPRSRPSR